MDLELTVLGHKLKLPKGAHVNLITPNGMTVTFASQAELADTGFCGAAERTIRGKVLRVDWWIGEEARFKVDGVELDDDEAWRTSRPLAKLMRDSRKVFIQMMPVPEDYYTSPW